jgi:hypothetical protein
MRRHDAPTLFGPVAITALGLAIAGLVVAGLVVAGLVGGLALTSSEVDAANRTASTSPVELDSAPRLLKLEAKIVEVGTIALSAAGIRLNGIGPEGDDEELVEKAVGWLGQIEEAPGTRLLADLSYTIAAGRSAKFSSGVKTPTRTTSLSGGGVSMQGFGGYQESMVAVVFRAAEGRKEGAEVLLDVDFQSRARIGTATDGLPPVLSSRDGSFTARIPSGELRVFGGMIRSDEDSSYLLFYLKPTWIE